MEPLPSMTIVTATYNRGSLVEAAVASVLSQHYPGVLEHIIIDGSSTDDTLVRLSRYPHLKVISEPDEGVYDAWNKGIGLAAGDVVGILNSDDQFGPGVLNAVGEVFARRRTLDMVVGRAVVFADLPTGRRQLLEVSERATPRFGIENLRWVFPMINARLFHRRLFERIGLFDTRYEVEADLDFMVRLALSGAESAYVDRVVMEYRSHKDSMTFGRFSDAHVYSRERLAILTEHLRDRALVGRRRRTLRRLHSWQCCTAIAMLPRPRSLSEGAGFVMRGLAHDPLFAVRMMLFAFSPRRHANVWSGVEKPDV